MSKKKHHEQALAEGMGPHNELPETPESAAAASESASLTTAGNGEAHATPPDPLQLEVESFLAQREQLALRLAGEIAAAERRLAELRRTAAALFPASERAPEPAKKVKRPRVARPAEPASGAAVPAGE